ncbi:MAG: rod shape-determining protein MreC [Endomicrobium sp.]|jgi:rod shape-determining protein MreC|nr:rod shape-determining protein MreC [Endomicrobium sp.]
MREIDKIKKYGTAIFAVLLVFGFALIFGRTSKYVNLIKSFVYYIAYPSVSSANSLFCCTGRFFNTVKSLVSMHQEIVAGRRENRELKDKLRNYDIILKEYNDLSKLLNLGKIKNTKSVFAGISAREPGEWYQWLIIDKGKNYALKRDFPVLIFNRNKNMLCALGRIAEVYKSSAKIVLITNSNYEFPVEIKNKNITCLAGGFNSRLIKISYIPSGSDVKAGDEVVVSGLSSVFPSGVPVGVIKEVGGETCVDFKTASAEVYFESGVIYYAVVLVPEGNI